ncbi:N-6 DNA methylase [bacterium]|nr:N-6 DNA methylase [bacterium]MBU1065422.1 N-6 DNA methylase [bacterium]MBU1633528.1 N-6 DNA methylase [bacterium]MBU1874990.1 N-6 DNA methylase [bacterium]
MLDLETKRKINNARDILVGKVPDPKSQVEQITIALIYKFMDDMDKESVGWGGKPTFFSGEYEKYAWSKIFDPKTGGHELIKLYQEAIEKLNHNPNIPQLFRDIFKNAYLPYRDPETLKMFLKEINEFTYDHSERLGDAFEYLLSVLSSQGAAGQFRTPRHIIDFIVAVVSPRKAETILDPACGTAGFLISAYKHILQTNGQDRPGDQLDSDEQRRLLTNFTGYDISPDMIRLALVNMYLHGFPNPQIHEYDTLSSESRWDETFDVILANPPFMTPKGGIRPHKRFSIQANRSEVLFVDYIAEHLNPGGRAGVIVPEGIIFQSSNAYKTLRKMLVENYLWAVVSLPAGIFQPYSGVKTSILLMDKAKAKQSDAILFVKVDNDGFDLGAQRRAIDKNDLTQALQVLKSGNADGSELAHFVEKSRIAESGDWNLSGERYKDDGGLRTSHFELKKFDEVCTLEYGASLPKKNRVNGDYPVIGSNGITGWHNEYLIESPAIVVGRKGSAGEVTYIDNPCFPIDTTYYIKPVDGIEVNMKYLYLILKGLDLPSLKGGAGIPGLNRNDVYEMRKIPLPPLSVQEEIVAEIDGYQKIIDGARQVVDNWKPTIKIDPDWEMVELGNSDFFDITSGGTPSSKNPKFWDCDINWATLIDLPQQDFITILTETKRKITEEGLRKSSATLLPVNSILVSSRATIGRIAINKSETATNQGFKNIVIKDFSKTDTYFVALMVSTLVDDMDKMASGGTFKEISKTNFSNLQIPHPPLSTQQKIVAQIEAEQEMVNANKKLITIYEQKIKDKIAEVWGE